MEKNTSKSTVTETVKSDRDKRLDSMGIPRSRLVSIPEMLTRLEIASAGAASLQELTDALSSVYDGETLYNGAWSGLSEQITGIEPGECSDYNQRADIITDLFNRQWWEPGNSDKPIEFANGRTFCDGLTPNTTMVLKEDAEKLSSDIWAVFFPGEKLPANSIQGGLSHRNALQAELEQESQRSAELAAEAERLRNALEILEAGQLQDRCAVELPHLTRSMESLFCVMRNQWTKYNPENPPKSSAVASAIDAAMGWSSQKSGEASRNAQALASLIRPDEIADADPRNARRR